MRFYGKDSPVPGSCNTEPGIPIKPYLEVSWSRELVHVSFKQAGHFSSCANIADFTYDVYQMYLPEEDCSQRYFLMGYTNFARVEDILENGFLVATLSHHTTEFSVSNYPRTGRLLAVVVNNVNSSAVYGLAHTYGWELDDDPENTVGCRPGDSTFVWVSCALGVFIGLFLTFMGHRFFKSSQFMFGFYFGSLVGFTLLSLYTEYDDVLRIVLSGTSGLLSAGLVLLVWWFLGIPVLSVVLPTLEVGFLLASVLMYLPLCNMESFSSDSTYWLVFTCFTLTPTVLFIAFTQKASIISSVVIGTFTLVLSVDHYTGSNLSSMLTNVLYRATVPDYGAAFSCPPFQKMDLFLVTCLLGCIALGLVCQLILERKKPPFPPAPYQQWAWARTVQAEDERTPLIDGEVAGSPEELPGVPVVGFISGHPGSVQPGSAGRNRSRTNPNQVNNIRPIQRVRKRS